jgi:hypothetical protein
MLISNALIYLPSYRLLATQLNLCSLVRLQTFVLVFSVQSFIQKASDSLWNSFY